MNRRRLYLATGIAIALISLAAGVALRARHREPGLAQLQQLTLPDLHGRPQTLSQWRGKVLVVNFWAPWCDPCREEVPALVKIQRKDAQHGVQVVGIGIDSADKISEFAAKYKVNYPLAVAGIGAVNATRPLGNRAGALPFTVIIDRRGRLVATHLGRLTEAQLDALLKPLLVPEMASNSSNL